jgi:hypothetical protein
MKLSLRVLLLMLISIVIVQPVFAQVAITVAFAPPALPVYEQPVCPDAGYLWMPGYWAYDPDDGYYWVPGTWVMAPEPGYLWTPAWWGWENNAFLFHEGYWATEVGFYGGVNYGFGYFGVGFGGGRWDGGVFRYNTAVVNVNTTIIHNTYIDRTVIVNNTTVNRVSYNGGEGGITARPTPQEQRVEQIRHIPPVAAQTQHIQAARSNPQLRASANQGKPPVAATAKPGEFSGRGVVEAKEAGAPYKPAPARGGEQPGAANNRALENPNTGAHSGTPTHASELQPHQPAAPANTGNPKVDQKYQKQQAQLAAKQNQEHQKMQQQQEKEDQKAAKASPAQKQQVEQKHQQQTQQLEQRHTQQQQQLQTRQAPRPAPAPKPR